LFEYLRHLFLYFDAIPFGDASDSDSSKII